MPKLVAPAAVGQAAIGLLLPDPIPTLPVAIPLPSVDVELPWTGSSSFAPVIADTGANPNGLPDAQPAAAAPVAVAPPPQPVLAYAVSNPPAKTFDLPGALPAYRRALCLRGPDSRGEWGNFLDQLIPCPMQAAPRGCSLRSRADELHDVHEVPKTPAIGPTVAAPSPAVISAPAEVPDSNMSTYDVDEVPVRSVPSSAGAIETRMLRNSISPTEITSTGTYPECMITPNTAERFLPVSNVAVAPVHPSHSGNFRLLVRLLATPDGPEECAAATSSCCIPQSVQHGALPERAPISMSLMDTTVPAGTAVLAATVHKEPSARNTSAAAIAFAGPDLADQAVAEVTLVHGEKQASHPSVMDHGPETIATALHALSTVSPLDENTKPSTATTVMAAHGHGSMRMPTSGVFGPADGHEMWVADRNANSADPPNPAPAVDMRQNPRQDQTDDSRCKVVQSGKRCRPDVLHIGPSSSIDIGVGGNHTAAVTVDIVDPAGNEHGICTAVGSPRMVTSPAPDTLVLERTCGDHVNRRSAPLPPSLVTATVAIFMRYASVPAPSLAALAAVNRALRFQIYSSPDVDRHVSTNMWCRTLEYAAALADAPCSHIACHCRQRFQRIPAELRRERLASIVPFHVVLQRWYDERYGYHNGQYLDSPSERKAVLRQLRTNYPELAVSYSTWGRLSLTSPSPSLCCRLIGSSENCPQLSPHPRSAAELLRVLKLARSEAAGARLDIGNTRLGVPVVAKCAECRGTCPYDLYKCSTLTCVTWMHASCKVRQCLHYLLELECERLDAGPVDWQCTECTIVLPPAPTCARATGSPRGRSDLSGHNFCEFEPCCDKEPSLTRVLAPFPFVHPLPRLLTNIEMRRMPMMWPRVKSVTDVLYWISQHSYTDATTQHSTTTVKVVHERRSNPASTSYVNCSTTIGHAMCKNDRPVCHADPPAPAPAVGILQCPGQENADDDRCTVVQPSKRFRPDVQHFGPTLRDHADAGITEWMAVDAANH